MDHISHDEERRLGRLAKAGDLKAKDQFVEAFKPFAVWVAIKHNRCGVPMHEMIQACMLGLLESFERYDPERPTRFITMAFYGVRRRALEQVYEALQTRMGTHSISLDAPSPGRADKARLLSLSAVFGGIAGDWDSPRTLGETIIDDRTIDPSELATNKDAVRKLNRFLGRMKKRTREIVRMRLGIGDYSSPTSYVRIGRRFGISAERARRVFVQAIARLRIKIGAEE